MSPDYIVKLQRTLASFCWNELEPLKQELKRVWVENQQVFLCGNGGSAANADHAANDLVYGLCPSGVGINAHSLCANFSVNSCAANDTGYENIFSYQLKAMGKPGDLLIVFSGSGNSENVIRGIETANNQGMTTAGVLGFKGGKAKQLLDIPVHFLVDDMQIAEDLQMIVVHMIVQQLRER